jgi:hypothetical protein
LSGCVHIMGGKASRDKGARGELELQKILQGARIRGRILTARKVPLSGMCPDFKGDLMVGEQPPDGAEPDHRTEEIWEVKRRAQGFKVIDKWLDDAAVVCYRRDRGEWIVTMRLKDLIECREIGKENGSYGESDGRTRGQTH